ncbi:hypothetical protein Metig_0895 [Methanotorris igneus Kol 5]|uniref:Uncharacterized protein n=1 Tax=Methanotorris igneus (strain DSM 5666 / JCM 11834 / Kol 5) TaxID=880724 RepID=F6BD77_METIK|nr:hypothetical protein Metig_0895 [Methanotorris igneus Kol 5]
MGLFSIRYKPKIEQDKNSAINTTKKSIHKNDLIFFKISFSPNLVMLFCNPSQSKIRKIRIRIIKLYFTYL